MDLRRYLNGDDQKLIDKIFETRIITNNVKKPSKYCE